MARGDRPAFSDNKYLFFREQLMRELAHMFVWEGLPQTVPHDFLERNLVRHGYVLFYEDEDIGLDVLRAEPFGYNRHDMPVSARTFTPTTNGEVKTQITRNLKYLSSSESAIEDFDPLQDGVLIRNMEYGQSMWSIVEHFAKRLAMVQQAFDTNLLWQNIPYIFLSDDDKNKLSVEKILSDVENGKPHLHVDKQMFYKTDGGYELGTTIDVDYIADKLLDTQNEIMMKFRQTIGIDTAGVDKLERTNTMEIESNTQHTKTVLEIMKQQRDIACESINAFYGLDMSISVVGLNREGDDFGTGDGGIEESTKDEF